MVTIYRCQKCGAEDRDRGQGDTIPDQLLCYRRRQCGGGIMLKQVTLPPEEGMKYVLASGREARSQ